MVYINDKKFACESCIKGHRSSSCHHNSRSLFEIKKKGRPVSQCGKCRELRKIRRVHSKCMCDEKDVNETAGQQTLSTGSKSRKLIHIAPALPDDLNNSVPTYPSLPPANTQQKVDSPLNPRHCETILNHCCSNSSNSKDHDSGLITLAEAAVMVTNTNSLNITESFTSDPTSFDCDIYHTLSARLFSDNAGQAWTKALTYDSTRGPDLPPILLSRETGGPSSAFPFSSPLPMPPMTTMVSLAGTGCPCGFECTCPECIEHRVPPPSFSNHSSAQGPSLRELKDCADGCGHCVDHEGELALARSGPSSSSGVPAISQTMTEEFLARALNLPPPPRNRMLNLDPTNTVVFPMDIFSKERQSLTVQQMERMVAWGLVSIPKLQCGHLCGCLDDCGCDESCQDCGVVEDDDRATGVRHSAKPLTAIGENELPVVKIMF